MDKGLQLLREGLPVFDPDELHEVGAGRALVVDESKAVMRIPESLSGRLHPQVDWYLVVRGDSMDRVNLRDGDIVAIARNPELSEGDLVVARIKDAITLKRFHRTRTSSFSRRAPTPSTSPSRSTRRPRTGRSWAVW